MTPTRTLILTATLLALVAAAWVWHSQSPAILQQLGMGQPLPSNTSIQVLESGQPLATSTAAEVAAVSISTPTPAPVHPAVFDKTAAQLGTTLSLLLSSWPEGGPLPRQLANAAAQLASQTGQPALAAAAANLRSSTPREGPSTKALLLVTVAQTLTLAPPDDLPQDDTAAEAQKSWLRKQLEALVRIRSTPQTQNRWSAALLTVQQQIARGVVADAMQTLSEPPLAADDRLNILRQLIQTYLSQTGKLTHTVTTYTNTYLNNKDTE